MKKAVVSFLVITLLNSCGRNSSGEKPEKFLKAEVMENILWDFTVMEAIRSNSLQKPGTDSIFGAPYVFAKYGIDSLQFAQNEMYYARNPKKYLEIHQRLLKRLEKTKDSLDAITNKELGKPLKD